MTPEQIFQLLIAVGGSAGIATILTALFSRRKIIAESQRIGVDSAQVLSAASVALLEPMQKQLSILSTQLSRAQSRADTLDDKLRDTQGDLASCNALVRELTDQLTYYRDKYGPPTDELTPIGS